tara:strand:- start:63 stop:791 length:729 start_codon:yes stop_codon:yes gene_type:complete
MRRISKRLDELLVDRGVADNLELAKALILAGRVFGSGSRIDKPGTLVSAEINLRIKMGDRYVGRGGIKLEHVLHQIDLEKGNVALDIGASTGGFTDCLLQDGFQRVYSVDVGRGQLANRLVNDSRVIVMENINAKTIFWLPESVDLITIDVSFISVKKILNKVAGHLVKDGTILALIKPQFEARKEQVERGGIIRDPKVHARIVGDFCIWAIQNRWRVKGVVKSPVKGHAGNCEFFVVLKPS